MNRCDEIQAIKIIIEINFLILISPLYHKSFIKTISSFAVELGSRLPISKLFLNLRHFTLFHSKIRLTHFFTYNEFHINARYLCDLKM